MVPQMEKSRVMEIQVRMDCNGCVRKIKKALHGINGIQDIYINIPQQKLTIIGWADPEKIVKAIKKTRKHATICTETKPFSPTKPPSENGTLSKPVRPPKERENRPPGPPPSGSNKAEEVHAVHHYPPDHGRKYNHEQVYNATVEHYSSSPSPRYKHERLQPIHVNHSYNTYKPTPYVTEYTHIRPPPQYTHYNRPEPPLHYTHYNRPEPPQPYKNNGREEPPPPPQFTHYGGEYRNSNHGNGSITSIFSDDNPNACTIV